MQISKRTAGAIVISLLALIACFMGISPPVPFFAPLWKANFPCNMRFCMSRYLELTQSLRGIPYENLNTMFGENDGGRFTAHSLNGYVSYDVTYGLASQIELVVKFENGVVTTTEVSFDG